MEDLLHSTGPDRGSVSVRTATLKTGEQERQGAHSAVLQALPTLPEKLSELYCNEQTEVNKPVCHRSFQKGTHSQSRKGHFRKRE